MKEIVIPQGTSINEAAEMLVSESQSEDCFCEFNGVCLVANKFTATGHIVNEYHKAMVASSNKRPAAPNDDGWTYCEDRLPDEDGYYLATVGSVGIDPDETTCHELNWFKGKWYLPNDEMIEIGPVIAWRRKPEPAKGRDV